MGINSLKLSANRQHKATMAIASRLVGVPEYMIVSCPVITRKAGGIYCYAPGIRGEMDTDFINSYIMNGAFALELKFKYLHELETHSRLEEGHRLQSLFTALTNETKAKIRDSFKAYTKTNELCKEVTKVMQSQNIQYSWDLHKLLSNSNMAFERWRYIYEDQHDPTWFAGYSELQHSLDLRIAELVQ